MRIPKEFMMMPIGGQTMLLHKVGKHVGCTVPQFSWPGFPDKFVRYNGRRLFVHSRKDDPDVEFKAASMHVPCALVA